ncbi:Mitochondrial substrate carrier [Cordyceps fumosorosea ARSEF 2679]|uniref:Mitochondrial thiamine pyrophosphate carrier 1 n=1 Tax=Cordyceps fumosorosea (strain ARSEF 2679) TaxID=1081104 RepID=A0A168E8E7_CORFA|nr:Mitochondrial substrate carrier [Cordyceps fumosorosea ARSEF 2679]OAA73497.1 Mitochondrial substrate carrier [Cordyceps fumosorosea ARSEF 2679]
MPPGALKDEGTRVQVISAGAIAGLVSRFVIAPLDVIKIRLQLQHRQFQPIRSAGTPAVFAPAEATYQGTFATLRHILRNEGITAFWKGNVPAELLYVCYGASQFTAYRSVTLLLQTQLPVKLPDAAESFIAGAGAGAAATAVTYPLDLLRTRFAAQGTDKVYRGLAGAVAAIYKDEGPRGFFRGVAPTLAQIVPYMGIFFVTYEGLKPRAADLQLPWGTGDATAGIAGSVIAKTAVFPLDLIRKRIQVQGPTRTRYVYGDIPEYRTTLGALRTIIMREGFRGLYKGLPISLVKAAPGSAVTVWTYERALHFMIQQSGDRQQDALL